MQSLSVLYWLVSNTHTRNKLVESFQIHEQKMSYHFTCNSIDTLWWQYGHLFRFPFNYLFKKKNIWRFMSQWRENVSGSDMEFNLFHLNQIYLPYPWLLHWHSTVMFQLGSSLFHFLLDFTIKMVSAEKHLKETNEKERWRGMCGSHSNTLR